MLRAEDFWARVTIGAADDCWEWTGFRTVDGYGRLTTKGRQENAHRIAWRLTNGPIPPGEHYGTTCVLHACDNPPCCNPAHLFLGTQQDNIADMRAKGRERHPGNQGEAHPMHRLTPDAIREIRRRRTDGEELAPLARDFGVTKQTISKIARRERWAHIPEESHAEA